MKSIIFSIGVCAVACSYATPLQVNACNTQEYCPVNQTCSCKVIPSSAYDRYFYVQFTGLQAHKTYTCDLYGDRYFVDFNGSSFPEGLHYQCTSDRCPYFPIEILADTQNMSEDEAAIKLRYFVPAGDITFPITFQCTIPNTL